MSYTSPTKELRETILQRDPKANGVSYGLNLHVRPASRSVGPPAGSVSSRACETTKSEMSERERCRFIPARAGNCSGTPKKNGDGTPAFGSSPRVRGTRVASWGGRSGTVHPRACGGTQATGVRRPPQRFIPARAGNASPVTASAIAYGSSPRVRGTSLWLIAANRAGPVHPRACGEHISVPSKIATSSVQPRVCGEQWRAGSFHRNRRRRFIPARAGNARAGGCYGAGGSSPRVRGNSLAIRSSATFAAVHPRACGERSLSSVTRCLTRFIPRACGEHFGATRPDACARRFIPARAGNTAGTAESASTMGGSSPRVWGTMSRPSRRIGHFGSSPRVPGTACSFRFGTPG